MTEFLSDDWFDDLEARADAASPDAGLRLTIEQAIHGEPEIRWQVIVIDGAVRVDRQPASEPDVRIVTDHPTAVGIQAGEISAQRAFLDGRLRIGGDIQALMTHRDALAELGLGLA